jgi:hypothetical protein
MKHQNYAEINTMEIIAIEKRITTEQQNQYDTVF